MRIRIAFHSCAAFLMVNLLFLAAQGEPVDTASGTELQAGSDSTSRDTSQVSGKPAADSLTKGDSVPAAAAATAGVIDTSYRIWHRPFWGIGMGWEFGSMPVYDQWNKGLPSMITDTVTILNGDFIFKLPLTIKEKPSVFNVSFPISLSATPLVRKNGFLTVSAEFYWMAKTFKASLVRDSNRTYLSMEKKLIILSPAVGFAYSYIIPEKYFTISKAQQSSFVWGLSASPYVLLREKISIDPGAATSANNYAGVSVSWRVGLLTLRMLSPRGGLISEFVYTGSWNGRFMHDDRHVTNSFIDPSDSHPDERLAYFSTRFRLSFTFITGKASKQSAALPPASDSTQVKK